MPFDRVRALHKLPISTGPSTALSSALLTTGILTHVWLGLLILVAGNTGTAVGNRKADNIHPPQPVFPYH